MQNKELARITFGLRTCEKQEVKVATVSRDRLRRVTNRTGLFDNLLTQISRNKWDHDADNTRQNTSGHQCKLCNHI